MARVEMSRWPCEYFINGLIYPECPFAGEYDDVYVDVKCNGQKLYCSTVLYVGKNACPFDVLKKK